MIKNLGIDIGSTTVKIAIRDESGALLKTWTEGEAMANSADDGYAGDFAAEHFGLADQETAMRRSASFCRHLL